MPEHISGAEALARGALESGVALVASYPGAPVTAVVNRILAVTASGEVRVEWASNEKAAAEMAFGASLGGSRALLCVKSVGLNIALDPLMVFNLSGCNAGMVVLVGDDPGSWGSQNEQDSRAVIQATELPMLEPATVPDAQAAMREAFQLSEEAGLPVFVRITRALILAEGPALAEAALPTEPPSGFLREFMRWVVLPVNVVDYHRRLHQRLEMVKTSFEDSPLNGVEGDGFQGVIAAGFVYQKLMDTLGGTVPPELRILRLGTFSPFPSGRVTAFLQTVESALVLEETAPLVERAVRAAAQEAKLTLPIYGRDTGHLTSAGELFAPHLAAALNRFSPTLTLSEEGETERPRPSRTPLNPECPYLPIFDALLEVITQMGDREDFVIVGDPGCMVRAQESHQLMDVKGSLGSSIGMAAGIALSLSKGALSKGASKSQPKKRVIALSGDSGFLHSNYAGLMDAVQMEAQLLVLVLDNGTTALSGGQPHPASAVNARGISTPPVDLAALARTTGAGLALTVEVARLEYLRNAIEEGMKFEGTAVVIARGLCPPCPTLK